MGRQRRRRVREPDRPGGRAPLDVEALARGAHMSAGHLSREFRLAYGESSYGYLMTQRIERETAEMPSCVAKQVTRPIRNREVRITEPHLA